MDDQTILKNLRKDVKYLDQVYLQNKEYCLNFMKRKHQDFEAIKDIYQDAVIVFYEKALDENFNLSCSIQTYLNSICHFQVLNRFKKDSKMTSLSDDVRPDINDWLEPVEIENETKHTAIESALQEMKRAGGNCFEILSRYFYQKQSMEEIAISMNYTNSDNVKNQKSRCQKRLKEMTFKNLIVVAND